MAKPGSSSAREIAGRAVDLSLAKLSDEKAYELQAVYELKSGRRCGGCHRRIGLGMVFTSIDPRNGERPILRLAACSRDDCDFMERCRDGAVFMQAVEYAWLDEAGVDAVAPAGVRGMVFVDAASPL